NGSPISGATNNPLQLSSVSRHDAGSYSVVVINTIGTTNSSPATLSVVPRVSVGLFNDAEFVSPQIAENLAGSLGQLGHTARPFNNLALAITNDVIIFPQFENGSLMSELDSAGQALLQAYVLQGGVLISQGGYANFDLINSLFGFSLSSPGYKGKTRSEEHTSELQSPYELVCG